MHLLLLLPALLQDAAGTASSQQGGTGLEWMAMASVIVPVVLLVALIYLGRSSRVA